MGEVDGKYDAPVSAVKTHYSVNVLMYEVARWLFLGDIAIDSKRNPKFDVKDDPDQLMPVVDGCPDWKMPLEKRMNPNRKSEERKPKAAKKKNYEYFAVKLTRMKAKLDECFPPDKLKKD